MKNKIILALKMQTLAMSTLLVFSSPSYAYKAVDLVGKKIVCSTTNTNPYARVPDRVYKFLGNLKGRDVVAIGIDFGYGPENKGLATYAVSPTDLLSIEVGTSSVNLIGNDKSLNLIELQQNEGRIVRANVEVERILDEDGSTREESRTVIETCSLN